MKRWDDFISSLVFEYVLIIFSMFLLLCAMMMISDLKLFNERSPLNVFDAELLVCDHKATISTYIILF